MEEESDSQDKNDHSQSPSVSIRDPHAIAESLGMGLSEANGEENDDVEE